MARKMKKFSAGGAQGKLDRRMADIEKDYKKDSAGKVGLARSKYDAKREQRIADAKDDFAKRTGADRTATRAAETAAEKTLSKARRNSDVKSVVAEAPTSKAKVTDSLGAVIAPKSGIFESDSKSKSFGAAFKEARARLGAGKTFTYNGKSFTTNVAGEGRKVSTSSTNKGAATPPVSTNKGAATPPKSGMSMKELEDSVKADNTKTPPTAAAAKPKESAASLAAKEAAERARVAKLTGNAGRRARFADIIGFGSADAIKSRANVAKRQELIAKEQAGRAKVQAVANQQRAAAGRKEEFINRKVEGETGAQRILRINRETAANKAKGGTIKKEKTMKYRNGGSTPPQPTPADRARSKAQLDSLKKAKTTDKEGKVVSSANRSEGRRYAAGGVTKEMPSSNQMGSMNMAKGGKAKMKPAAKAKGKSFAATKFGAAMMKKGADAKGRAMPKFAKGGSIDGCAVKGKTKGKMMAKGGKTC